jgi:hypothetical protein
VQNTNNINIPFRVYKQRLHNQSHFDSGTAATIIIIKNPTAIRPDNRAFQHQRALGAPNPITYKEILKLEQAAAPRLRERAIHCVLSFLIDSPDFDLASYAHKDNPVFEGPAPCEQLPFGHEHRTVQYMLNTIHMEEASYDGNDRVLSEWWRQLDFASLERQKELADNHLLVWVGDWLTVARLRGLQKFRCMDLNLFDRLDFIKPVFGWFHALIAVEHSLHTQYYGTRTGFGLHHAFDLLKRKGLHAPSIQGNFHYSFQDVLYHIAEGHFRDLWCVVGEVTELKELRKKTPQELYNMATLIVRNYASKSALRDMTVPASGNNGKAKKGAPKPAKETVDDLLYQTTQFLRDLLNYLEIDNAISVGDIGRMQDMLPRFSFVSRAARTRTTQSRCLSCCRVCTGSGQRI